MELHPLTPDWEFVADTVMGGVSTGALSRGRVRGRDAVRLQGGVSLDNNGGFVQVAGDVATSQDLRDWTGVALDVTGNGEVYDLRLRTDDLTRPWQSYRTEFTAPASWDRLTFPFAAFETHKTDTPLDITKLRRIGVVAIGREFQADVSIGAVHLYR